MVIDVDPAHGGLSSLRGLIASNGPLPITMSVGTGSNGLHFYFCHPGPVVRNDAGRRLGPGLDVRGDGGYVIAPPSRHATGRLYRWATDAPPAPLPQWIAWRLHTPRHDIGVHRELDIGAVHAGSWARVALEREIRTVRASPQGNRNHSLNRAAFNLGQIVGGGALDRSTVELALLQAAMATGLDKRECCATIASGLSAGQSQPRGPSRAHSSRSSSASISIESHSVA